MALRPGRRRTNPLDVLMTVTLWADPSYDDGADHDPYPAVWELDRALCDLTARRIEGAMGAQAAALDAYVSGNWWDTGRRDVVAATRNAWLEVGMCWPYVDPSLPTFIAGLLAEYRRHAMDNRKFLRRVWAVERRLRGDDRVHGDPKGKAGWRLLADILPGLWI